MTKKGIPHARGGEPEIKMSNSRNEYVFPTHVGVNLRRVGGWRLAGRRLAYSPRTWG